MPWDDSDPGKRNSNDRRGRNEPPDLDEIVADFRNKVTNLFGGLGKGGSGGSSSGQQSGSSGRKSGGRRFLITIGAIVLLGFWISSGLYVVEQGEQGVELRFGKYTQTTGAGLRWHLPTPIEEVIVVNVQKVNTVEVGYRVNEQNRQINPVNREALMLTADENIIDIQFAVQYDIKDPKDLLFNVSDQTHLVVRQATESAVREIVGGSTMDFAITEGRAEIAQGTKTLLQEILDRYKTGVNVRAVEMQNAQPPAEVKAAFDDAVKAREDEERLKNEAEAYFNDVIPRARGTAARIMEEAQAYKESVIARAEGEASRFEQIYAEYEKAPNITRDRLYLEAIEQVLNNSTKLVIDQTNGNNIIYLPLDQIIQRQQNNQGNTLNSSSSSTSGSTSNFVESSNRTSGRSGRIQG